MGWLNELLFGKKESPQLSLEELEKETARQEAELKSKTRIVKAKTEYDKARIDHAKVLSQAPKGTSGMVGLFSKKGTWYIVVAIIFIMFIVVKAC